MQIGNIHSRCQENISKGRNSGSMAKTAVLPAVLLLACIVSLSFFQAFSPATKASDPWPKNVRDASPTDARDVWQKDARDESPTDARDAWPTDEEVRRALQEAVSEAQNKDMAKEGWGERIQRWIEEFLKRLDQWIADNFSDKIKIKSISLNKGFLIVILIVLFASALPIMIRAVKKWLNCREDDENKVNDGRVPLVFGPEVFSGDVESYLRKSMQYAEQGLYKDALRYCFYALLAQLARDGLISYDPSKTDTEYRMELRERSREAYDLFTYASRLFGRKEFRGEDCSEVEYREYAERCGSLFSRKIGVSAG